jgi:Replication protein
MTTVSHAPENSPGNLVDAPVCQHCGSVIVGRKYRGGRVQRYCNEACRSGARRRAILDKSTPLADTGARMGRRQECEGGPGLAAVPGVRFVPNLEPVAASPWYLAKFASPSEETAGQGRRAVRYKLRQLLREITEVDRCRKCGREIMGGAVAIKVKGGIAHFSGVETCGRVWLCPVCAAKIRARRGDEVAEGVGRWIADGHAAYFATATLHHDQGDALKDSLDVLTKSWRALMSTKSAMIEKKWYGVIGNIKAVEVTHGRNGWHPHIHSVILVEDAVEFWSLIEWMKRLDGRWSRALVRNGWDAGKVGVRFQLDSVNRATTAQLAAYVTKVQEAGLGNEIARADLKRGRRGSRTPMQILADFGTDGHADDLALWLEYEEATQGKSAIRWSRGLRDRLLPDVAEQSDDDIAGEDVGGDETAFLLPHVWYRLADSPGAQAAVLDAVEADGWEGLLRTLIAYRIDADGVLTPEEWRAVGGSSE